MLKMCLGTVSRDISRLPIPGYSRQGLVPTSLLLGIVEAGILKGWVHLLGGYISSIPGNSIKALKDEIQASYTNKYLW